MKQINGIDICQSYILKRKPGRYHGPSPLSGNTQVAVVANTLYAIPFCNSEAVTATSIGLHVTTLSAGGSIRLGIYNDNGSIYPGTLLLDAGTVSVNGTGVQEIAINQYLKESTLYWLVLVSDGIPSLASYTTGSYNSILGLTTTLNTNCPGMYRYAFAYAALPTIYTAGATVVINQYKIMLKL